MLNKLLGAATIAAVAFAVAPASAAKITAQKEVAAAQTAMLDGKMGACAMHLNKAMHAGAMNQATK